jgi:ABC-type xylose transport system substrate-binding protein
MSEAPPAHVSTTTATGSRPRSSPTRSPVGSRTSHRGSSVTTNRVTQLAKQGLAKPDVMVTNSNGGINLELTQLRSQITQGCDVIISFSGSATGLCSAIEKAADKGILFTAIG